MKTFIVVLAVIAAVSADVSHITRSGNDRDAQILRSDSDVGIENFRYSFETSNGISAQEQGQLKNAGREDEAIQVQGSNQYTAPDGSQFQLQYVADENGYQPQGAHLPTPPPPQPIPEYIERALAYIAAHPPQPEPQQARFG